MSLKEWLKNNQHIKTVTRDRANAYSSAIQEILPDAMQIADRFHLHQNLLEAIKNTVSSVYSCHDVRITINYEKKGNDHCNFEETCKKNALQCG
ncbi:MAG: transposase [Pilosibacter sp.]